ncbi:MAG: sigma factor-like helix-turn-helix DNA-binding protein [Candidatus Paceibacterota bacterium]
MSKDKYIISFKPKEVTKKLLATLSDRARDILIKRYGLKSADRQTLEAIGSEYKITRERVRQIENFAINAIRKSPEFTGLDYVFTELKSLMEYYGGLVHEAEFLQAMAKDKISQNHIHFLLAISDVFIKLKEDNEFYHRWTTDKETAETVHASIRQLCRNLNHNDLVSEAKLIEDFITRFADILDKFQADNQELVRRWLSLSKELNQNPLGEWGLAKSPNVRMRGIRDYAYLVLRSHGSPMHFTEVAKQIIALFGKQAHPATCHNELIKDDRFVLVGRGLYALTEWGYTKGVVADVLRTIIREAATPLSKEEIISRVLKERHVKENTILVNLQNSDYFRKDEFGRYFLA